MSNELHVYTTSGLTLYAVLLNSTGQVWNGSAFATINGASWTSYDIAMTEAAAGIYLATMPAAVTAGVYAYVVYEQAGGTPATSDTQRGSGSIEWDGDSEFVPTAATGAGSETVTITSTDNGSAPLEGVAVWVTSDSAGANVVAGTLYSSTLGVTTFYLDAGTYYVWRQGGGVTWTNPQTIAVTDV